jgi:DNA polymerase III sliding clamp (beta) subunit (PCNA family)
MKSMQIEAKYFYFASKISSKDETRPHIQGVSFESTPKELKLVATDGHRLIAFDQVTAVDITDTFSIIIKPTKDLVKACKPGKMDKVLEVDEDGNCKVISEVEVIYVSPTSLKLDVDFPNYRQVLPKSLDTETRVSDFSVNPNYLLDFGLDSGTVTINLLGHRMDPLVVSNAKYPNMIGVIMPMRNESGVSLSRWLDE